MAYKRKTKDVFILQQNWGYGWDDICEYDTRKEAKEDYKIYIENQPVPTRIVCRRIKLETII